MTITTRVQLYCDVGLKCTKQIAVTIEGKDARAGMVTWAHRNGWKSYGQRDACPACWAALHEPTTSTQEPEPDA